MQPSSRNEQLAVVLLHCCPGGPSSGRNRLRVPPPVTHAAESLPRQFCGGLHVDHDAGHALTVGRRHALTVCANSTAKPPTTDRPACSPQPRSCTQRLRAARLRRPEEL